jgi:hypothetical protein
MTGKQLIHTAGSTLAFGAAAAAGAYAAYAGTTWARYGHPSAPVPGEADHILDDFMPNYEVAERHHIAVDAPPELAFRAACEVDLKESPLVRGIFRAREVSLGSRAEAAERPRGLVALTRSIGWSELVRIPDREIVMGCATRPWNADVVFRPISSAAFRAFDEPGYAKIAWTLAVEDVGAGASMLRTETRVMTTDPESREKFRRYWAFVSPGALLIRRVMLRCAKVDAERRARARATQRTPDRFDLVSSGDLDSEC